MLSTKYAKNDFYGRQVICEEVRGIAPVGKPYGKGKYKGNILQRFQKFQYISMENSRIQRKIPVLKTPGIRYEYRVFLLAEDEGFEAICIETISKKCRAIYDLVSLIFSL